MGPTGAAVPAAPSLWDASAAKDKEQAQRRGALGRRRLSPDARFLREDAVLGQGRHCAQNDSIRVN